MTPLEAMYHVNTVIAQHSKYVPARKARVLIIRGSGHALSSHGVDCKLDTLYVRQEDPQ